MSIFPGFIPGPEVTGPEVTLIQRIDLTALEGIWVTQHFLSRHNGVKMWCGYCCEPLHYDYRHMGPEPFLTLMVKMADAHRATDCPQPQGPFRHDWHPRYHALWSQMWHDREKDE